MDKRFFSFIELLVTLVILSILVGFVIPHVIEYYDRTKENILRHNLSEIRRAIVKYAKDHKGRYPNRLPDLVSEGYLREIPEDPFLGRADKWQIRPPVVGPIRKYLNTPTSWKVNGGTAKESGQIILPLAAAHVFELDTDITDCSWFNMFENFGPIPVPIKTGTDNLWFPSLFSGGVYDVRSGDRVTPEPNWTGPPTITEAEQLPVKYYHRDIDSWDETPATTIRWPLKLQ